MLSIRFGLLGAIACLLAFSGGSNLAPSRTPVDVAGAGRLGHIRYMHRIQDKVEHGNGTASSSNWSGYAVLGSSFTSAEGSWVVPTTSCSGVSGTGYAAAWVGIDGYSSDTVEQTGTLAECAGREVIYYAWYEFYPAAMKEITSVPVSPGNVISASVSYSGSEFTVTLTNKTTGKTYSKTSTVSGAERTSAEWIMEAPCCTVRGGILPLANFGTAGYGDDYSGFAGTNYATDSTVTNEPIGVFGSADYEEITKTPSSSSPQGSTCSALSSDSTSFKCTWAAN